VAAWKASTHALAAAYPVSCPSQLPSPWCLLPVWLLLLITYHTAFNHGGAGPVFMTMHDISGGTAHDTHDTTHTTHDTRQELCLIS
jgi:hypothetical protein